MTSEQRTLLPARSDDRIAVLRGFELAARGTTEALSTLTGRSDVAEADVQRMGQLAATASRARPAFKYVRDEASFDQLVRAHEH